MKRKKTKKKKLLVKNVAKYELKPIDNGYLITVKAPKRPRFEHYVPNFVSAVKALSAIELGPKQHV